MPGLVKQCQVCRYELHARKLKCVCGHIFMKSKPSVCLKSTLETEESRRQGIATCQTHKRALESDHESAQRRKADAACKAHKRALESEYESAQHREADAACKAHKRALESEHELAQRRKAGVASKACKRALESEHESDKHREFNAACQAHRRALHGDDCLMMQLYDLCQDQVSAKVLLRADKVDH